MELPRTADVVIIGGGIIGIAAAHYLALREKAQVVVLEADQAIGGLTTGQCFGGFRFQFETRTNIALSRLSFDLLQELGAGRPPGPRFHRTGFVFAATSDDEERRLKAALQVQRSMGLDTAWVTPADLASHLPAIDFGGVFGGTWHGDDGWMDPKAVVALYVSTPSSRGVCFLPNKRVIGVQTASGRVTGVVTLDRTIATRVVLNAAGPWAPEVCRMVGWELPVTLLPHQVRISAPLADFPVGLPCVVFPGEGIGFRHSGENILAGSTGQHPYHRSESPQLDQDLDRLILARAVRRLPALQNSQVLSRHVGLYDVTPDGHAIVGELPSVAGFYCGSGSNGHGFMHAPAHGFLLACLITGAGKQNDYATGLDLNALSAARFASREQRGRQ